MKKKFISLTVTFMLFASFSWAQTSWDDYRYVTGGLMDDISKGKGVKAGYSTVDLGISQKIDFTDGQWRAIHLYSFNKGGVRKAIIVEFTDKGGSQSFKCIPSPSSEKDIVDAANSDFNSLPAEWRSVMMWAFIKLASLKLF